MIDYERTAREHPKQKRRLTLAIKSGKVERVITAVNAAVIEWREWGAWPDDWHRWNIAYQDATGDYRDISEVF